MLVTKTIFVVKPRPQKDTHYLYMTLFFTVNEKFEKKSDPETTYYTISFIYYICILCPEDNVIEKKSRLVVS